MTDKDELPPEEERTTAWSDSNPDGFTVLED